MLSVRDHAEGRCHNKYICIQSPVLLGVTCVFFCGSTSQHLEQGTIFGHPTLFGSMSGSQKLSRVSTGSVFSRRFACSPLPAICRATVGHGGMVECHNMFAHHPAVLPVPLHQQPDRQLQRRRHHRHRYVCRAFPPLWITMAQCDDLAVGSPVIK